MEECSRISLQNPWNQTVLQVVFLEAHHVVIIVWDVSSRWPEDPLFPRAFPPRRSTCRFMSPPPQFDFFRFRYTAEVKRPFTCHCYTAPCSSDGVGGAQTGVAFRAGEKVTVESEAHITERYVAVRTFAGWINVWTRDNKHGQPTGVLFCHLVWNWR